MVLLGTSMRKISIWQTYYFIALIALIGITAFFLSFSSIIAFIVLFYAIAIIECRRTYQVRSGWIELGSTEEFNYHVYLLFYLIFFYPIMRSGIVPVPLMRLFYQALGAKLGENTYSSGIILDPGLVVIGSNTIIGQNALIVPHVIESEKLGHFSILIGSNVTIGAGSIILSNTIIGDNVIVSAGSVVPKNSIIGNNEVWGGVPARRIK